MMTIIVPPELNIPAPAEMPIVELIRALYAKGYGLANIGGNLVAAPLTYRAPLFLDDCCRHCGQKKLYRCTCKRDLDNGN